MPHIYIYWDIIIGKTALLFFYVAAPHYLFFMLATLMRLPAVTSDGLVHPGARPRQFDVGRIRAGSYGKTNRQRQPGHL